MSFQQPVPGASVLARLSDLPEREADTIRALRLWCDGPSGQAEVWAAFSSRHGAVRGRASLKAFEDLVAICERHSRRRLMRHGRHCQCAGADECWFARLVALASDGCREDALMVAMVFVRPDVAMALPDLASEVGRSLPCLTVPPDYSSSGRTLH